MAALLQKIYTGTAALCLGLLLLLQLLPHPPLAAAQMTTPLAGQGTPGPNTTEVFISVYLDRLLAGEPTAVPACLGRDV